MDIKKDKNMQEKLKASELGYRILEDANAATGIVWRHCRECRHNPGRDLLCRVAHRHANGSKKLCALFKATPETAGNSLDWLK